ncbi:MAG: HD domain-containing protein [Clostridiales bacterium]|nr:HD domain-containing protein [Clostridiales bacterium]
MKRSLLFLLTVLLVLFSAIPQHALAADPYVATVYNERNGLPTGEANVVYQTSDHYMWIGSYGGLVRYDGSTFRNYSQEGLIPSSSIRALLEDREGRLWVGTNDAGLFVLENGAFTRVQEAGAPTLLCIRDIIQNKDGDIYAASSSGLGRVKDGVLVPVEDPLLTGETVYTLGADRYGRIWCSLNDWQCAVVAGDALVGVIHSQDVFPGGEQIYSVSSDKEGDLYLGSYENAVTQITLISEELTAAGFQLRCHSTGDVAIHNDLSLTAAGDVLVCGQRGFAWIDPEGNVRAFGEEASASGINSACRDYEGNFWLASGSYGVIRLSVGCYDTPNHIAGLSGVVVNSIALSAERYYLALDNGLMIFDSSWQPIENQLTESLSGIRIRQAISDKQGRIWLATYSANGAICYDPADESITRYDEAAGLTDTWIRTVQELPDGTIAAGTSTGFYLLKDGGVTAFYGHGEGLSNTTILCFAQDGSGTLYIGTDGGGMYALKDGTLTHHGAQEGLGEGVVLRLLADKQGGGLFVSAGSSLYYWKDNSYRKLSNFNKAAGSIFDMYLRNGKLWLLQNSGILEVDRTALLTGSATVAKTYSFSHGLTGSLNANTWNAITPDGRLLVTTRNGISIFSFAGTPNRLPDGIINAIQVDGEIVEHPEKLHLSRDAHRVTIDFAVLSYTDTSNYRIAYRLEGLDQSESIAADMKGGSISYTNLTGGEYTFHIRVFDPERPRNEHTYRIPITKEKKLVEQPLFWLGIALVFAGAVALVITLVSHLRHKNRLRLMNERQQELKTILIQSLQTFARIIDAKDPYTNGHSIRVAKYAREIARRMGMDADQQDDIYYIALLHDIGKIGIPDSILNKKGALTPEERAVIQTHPAVGGKVLANFTALEDIDDGARYHHERYDGKGYCEGLSGKDIPLVARIIGVADSYDAMASDRCYRPALTKEKILSELEEHSGGQFDPEIVPYMVEMIHEGIVPAETDEKPLFEEK